MSKAIKKSARLLGRDEMKKVKGGLEDTGPKCRTDRCIFYANSSSGWVEGVCTGNSKGACVCDARPIASIVTSACNVGVIIIE